jgi:UDP-N-acetylglucosamine acyltransferase
VRHEGIHPKAVVDESSHIEPGVSIGPYAIVGADVWIAAGTSVGAGAHLQGPTRIGKDNRIFPGACLGFDPQDLKYQGEETTLEVGDRNAFREMCTVNRGTEGGGGVTRIGNDNLFMAYSHIAHDSIVGNGTVFGNNAALAGHVEVGDGATISAFSGVQQFCRVGREAYIGGFTGLNMDALPFVKTVGVKPACYGVNRIGLERHGFSADVIEALSAALRILTRSGLGLAKALDAIRREHGSVAEVEEMVRFVEGSRRGVVKGLPGRRGSRGGD